MLWFSLKIYLPMLSELTKLQLADADAKVVDNKHFRIVVV